MKKENQSTAVSPNMSRKREREDDDYLKDSNKKAKISKDKKNKKDKKERTGDKKQQQQPQAEVAVVEGGKTVATTAPVVAK